MSTNSFSTSFTVDQTPEEVFAAVTDVRAWWGGQIDGAAAQVGDEFVYSYQNLHRSKQKVTEAVPGRRIGWQVVEGRLNFVEDTTEWEGTTLTFDIEPIDGRTLVRFTHVGLVPEVECYDTCSQAWGFYVTTSLRELIETGTGQPG